MEDKAIKIQQQEEEDELEKQHQEQPPKKLTKNIRGQNRDYIFMKSVKSVDELDSFRFKNYCIIRARKELPTFESLIVPCTRKRKFKPGKQCDFELMAVRQKSGTIDVYAHSEHNHPIMPEERRASKRKAKELMPAENPPRIYRTEDNYEWKFVQTFADNGQLQKFRKSQCTSNSWSERESRRRVRYYCYHRRPHNCEFTLLALKTTKKGYHAYTFGEHNHPIKPKKKQQPATSDHQQKHQEQGMEVDEEEEDEDDEDDEEEKESEAEEDEVEEGQNESIEEGGGGEGEQEDDIIVIDDDEDDGIKVEPKQEVKREVSMEITETPQGNEAKEDVEEGEIVEEEDDEDDQEENEAEEGEEDEDEEGEGQDEPIEEGGGGEGEQNDDIIVIDDDEDDGIKVEPKQEVKEEISMEKTTETPQANESTPRVETAKEKLQKAQAKAYYEWMAGFQANQIETTVVELDTDSVLEMVRIADQEIRENPEKFAVWRPWVEFAIKKCMFKIEGFGAEYKELIGLF